MSLKSLSQLRNISGKHVLVRVDFNVPIHRGLVLDDTRIRAALPTIKYLSQKKAKIILVTHIGRPGGEIVSSLKVDPVTKRLVKLLKRQVIQLDTRNWRLSATKKVKILSQIEKMRPGQIAIMENIRFSPFETDEHGVLAQELANVADYFVSDCFAVAHRASASITGVAKYIPAYAGLLMQTEVQALSKIISKPKKPFITVIGGAKVKTKIPVIKTFLKSSNAVLIGGGIFNTYLVAKKYKIGDSLIDSDVESQIMTCGRNKKMIKPIDVVVGNRLGKYVRVVDIQNTPHQICKKGEAIFDIGPKTIKLYAEYIKSAQTLVWNGAMGYFEQKPYDSGTRAIARLVASRSQGQAYGVIGGGETIQTMDMVGMTDMIDFVSTGGGSMLSFLAGEKLPGLEILKK